MVIINNRSVIFFFCSHHYCCCYLYNLVHFLLHTLLDDLFRLRKLIIMRGNFAEIFIDL